MKSFFGIMLVALLVFTFYVDNKSSPSEFPLDELKEASADPSYDQLLDIEEGEVVESTTPSEHFPGPNVGDKAIDFKLSDLTGKDVTLSQFKGKKVVVNFWATWCPPCKEEMPIMEEFYNSNREEVEVLAINIDPQYNVKEYQQAMGLTFPILLDEDDKINKAYDILTVPTTYVINEQGIITHKQIGALTSIESFNALVK
ncbi:TlpA family protein disulfide reductase [Rossellomorea aquimaris]|uniref:peroxiredoxin family protein n=1 Tax=Rossellomorea aquimaris TaxID=189382 RepID=UPI001CD46CAB|nr:TlpA disulfide reductase family protein [Rossellomorea aquimaris]MCA1053834.1 TlpA family protein disulfide reductase [Rossellomorea aquimaris]